MKSRNFPAKLALRQARARVRLALDAAWRFRPDVPPPPSGYDDRRNGNGEREGERRAALARIDDAFKMDGRRRRREAIVELARELHLMPHARDTKYRIGAAAYVAEVARLEAIARSAEEIAGSHA